VTGQSKEVKFLKVSLSSEVVWQRVSVKLLP
jgi:hypothetical protein